MAEDATKAAYSFQVSCPTAAAYRACADALAAMPNMSVKTADEAAHTMEISVRVSLWSRGEDIRLALSPVGETETRIDIYSETKKQLLGAARNRRNYDDLECAVRYQLTRLPG